MPGIWDTYNQTPTNQTPNSSAPDIWGTYADQAQQAAQTQADLNQPAWYEQALAALKQGGGAVLGALGTVLRPLSAPQQVLFGVLQGDPARGLRTAANDLTSWFVKPFSDQRITGKDLVESAASSLKTKGVPDAVSKWGGLALDLLADPALLATFGASAASKINAGSRVAIGLERTSAILNSPLKVAFQALPKASREALAQKTYSSFLGREIGSDGRFIPRQSVGQFLIPSDIRQRVYPEQVAKFEKMKQDAAMVGRAAGNMISERVQGLEKAYDSVLSKVPVASKQAFSEKMNEFVVFKNPQDAARTWQDLVDMGNAHGVDPQKLWSVLQHTTRVNTLSTGVMAGSSHFLNDLMHSRLGVTEQQVQGVARIAPETARLRLGIPEAGLQNAAPIINRTYQPIPPQLLQGVPQSGQNMITTLSKYTPVLYHQTDKMDFMNAFLDSSMSGRFGTDLHLAHDPAYALTQGQGKNKMLIELDSTPINGFVNTSKPGWAASWNNNYAEFIGRGNSKAYQDAVRSVTLPPASVLAADKTIVPEVRRFEQHILPRLKANGWIEETLPTGERRIVAPLAQNVVQTTPPPVTNTVFDNFGNIARAEADQTLTSTPVVNAAELLSGVSVRRGLHREFAVLGVDGEAHIARVQGLNRPVQVDQTALQNTLNNLTVPLPNAAAVEQSIISEVVKPGQSLVDALANVRQQHQLTGDQTKELLDGLLSSSAVIPSSNETAKFLRQFRAEAQVGPRGIPGTGAAGAAKQRNDALSAAMLADLGEVKDVLANAYRDASITGHEAAFQAKILGTKTFLEHNGLYIKPMSDLPDGVKINAGGGWAQPGHTTVTAAMSQASNGVLETGAIIPDFVAREFQIATTMKGAAGSSVLQKVLSRWQVLKLSNPPTIVQNVISNMVQAATYAPKALSPFDLLAGLKTRVTETAAMREARLGSGLGSWSEDMMGLRNKTDEAKRAMLGVKASSLDNAQAYFDDLIGAHSKGGNPLIPRVGDVASAGTTYVGRNLFTFYKATEDRMRDAAFYAFQKKGMSAAEAADHATQIFFDYSSRPGLVDATAKLGVPFQTYPNLAGWRTLSTLYDKPTFLRAQTQGRENFVQGTNDPKELKAAESWVANTMPVRIGQDSNGRGIYVPISQFLPMGATAAIADNVNNSLLGPIPMPPLLGLGLAVFGNTGFRGTETYKGLGGGAAEAFQNDPAETTRLALKELYKFGVYPWAPGTPVFERLTRAIMANGKTLQQLEDESSLPKGSLESFAARVGVNGPLLWGAGADPVGVTNPLIQRPSDLTPALARVLGLRSYEVQGNVDQVGAARSAVTGAQRLITNKKTYWKNRIRNAPAYARESITRAAMADLQKLGENAQNLMQELTQ